jgi:hypothetical protein
MLTSVSSRPVSLSDARPVNRTCRTGATSSAISTCQKVFASYLRPTQAATRPPEPLAGNKLLALFDRAAARDFADVYVLARRFGKEVLLARAAQIDAGFDVRVLADMIATLDRFTGSEIPEPDGSSAAELRDFYTAWRSELTA